MDNIKIPFSEFTFSFSRGSGPGGQNVNKVNSKVTMYWDLENSPSVSPSIKERFKQRFASQMLENGQIQLMGQTHRSQKANVEECIKKLHEMINSVSRPPKVRKATKPKRSAVLKRLDSKRKDSDKKRSRSKGYE